MIPALQHKNNILQVDNTPLIVNRITESYLTADSASGSGTITVANIAGFAVDQALIIGELGSENAELVKTHGSTAPLGTTITLLANTARAHYSGDPVYAIQYDQIQFAHADTATGAKTTFTAVDIDPTEKIQRYEETTETAGFYFARYVDSIDSANGTYTDALAFGGWASNTAGYMIKSALRRLGRTLDQKVTLEYCFDEINEALRYTEGKQLRWPTHYAFDYIAGQTLFGSNTVALPTDIYDDTSNKSIIGFRIGKQTNLTYESPQEFAERLYNVNHTQVRTQATSGATTLEIDNSYDFADSGTVNVYVSGTKYSITYTGVTRSASAGVLTGIPATGTGSITVTIPVDTDVWQNETTGTPTHFTVRGGNAEWYPLADGTQDDKNIYIDYAKVATSVDSEGDEIDYERYDMFLDYLTWKIWCLARNDGDLDMNNQYYLQFREKMNDAIRNMGRGVVFKMSPKLNKISWNRRPR